MGMGTAGAVLDAIARMRRAERELARPRRNAHLRHRRSHEGGAPDRLPFPCFFLCDACGRLEAASTADPMRRDGESGDAPGPCPACRAQVWIDLRSESVARAHREADAQARRARDDADLRRTVWIGAAIALLAGSAAVPWTSWVLGLDWFVLAMLPAGWLVATLAVAALARRMRPVPNRPRRWRSALPRPHGPMRRSVRGRVEGEASLRAPLSHTPCLGWSVQVWSDDGLLLDEQQHAALTVDGDAFEPDSVRLELAAREPTPSDETFARFLQRRGLSPHDESLRVREAVLVPGAAVAVEGRRPVPVLRASARAPAA